MHTKKPKAPAAKVAAPAPARTTLTLKKDALKDLSARRAASAVKGGGRSGSGI